MREGLIDRTVRDWIHICPIHSEADPVMPLHIFVFLPKVKGREVGREVTVFKVPLLREL